MRLTPDQLRKVNYALKYYIRDEVIREKAVGDIEILLSKENKENR